ncbi:MAG: hypothetical protein CVV13_10750 [Gammaproteobacteria bacterium HGW-Gammaproteobacteria-3]|nr:MAG: hypothetical protein CVV13_10750 [Gammaproteobacteria bacterium HGW-Gammaproteobacteria-3]
MKYKLLTVLYLLFPILSMAAPVTIEQQPPTSQTPPLFLPQKTQDGPDERVLWRLLHTGKVAELKRQINFLKQLHPHWQVPEDLTNALQSLQHRAPRRLRQTAKKTGGFCAAPYLSWDQAKNYIKNRQTQKALALYQRLLTRCQTPEVKKQTLAQGKANLAYNNFIQLTETAERYFPPMYLEQLRYQSLKAEYVQRKNLTAQEQAFYVTRLGAFSALSQEEDLTTLIAWRYFDSQDYPQAVHWFEQARIGQNQDATYGLLLSLEHLGDYERILSIIGQIQTPNPEQATLAARIHKLKAWQALDKGHYSTAASHIALARKSRETDPELTELDAWLAQKTRHYDTAAKLFEQLYRQTPSQKYAHGFVTSQANADSGVLAHKARQLGGLLQTEYNNYQARQLYFRKQFQSAYKLAPAIHPALQNITSAAADLGGSTRFKTGDAGLGRLAIVRAPIAGFHYTAFGDQTFSLSLSRVQLFSGRPGVCQANIGSLQDVSARSDCSSNPDRFFVPTDQLDNSIEIDFSYRKDGWFSPFIRLGSTPIGGIIAPAVTFDVGFVQQTGFGHWQLESYSQPIRQSILSYTGIKDPFRGSLQAPLNEAPNEWGRVLSTGFKSSVFYQFNKDWNGSGSIDFAWQDGKNVANNNSISVAGALGRNFVLKGFDYFNVGPSFNYQHFDKNLSHFTLGHGGYFSPSHYYSILGGVNFLTEEGRAYVIRGHVNAGFQGIKEASSPWFPTLAPELGRFDSAHDSGEALDIELKGVWLLTPEIQLGGGGAIRKTSGFEDYTGGLFIRYFFDARKASFSTDIPNTMFSSMY